ncbi:MAG: hypothetical protein LBJ96_00395 [Holosporaceae bacterium]|jgi:hypothetical protein|nr:hypothetical protein [Holosporaceae bacterium]
MTDNQKETTTNILRKLYRIKFDLIYNAITDYETVNFWLMMAVMIFSSGSLWSRELFIGFLCFFSGFIFCVIFKIWLIRSLENFFDVPLRFYSEEEEEEMYGDALNFTDKALTIITRTATPGLIIPILISK